MLLLSSTKIAFFPPPKKKKVEEILKCRESKLQEMPAPGFEGNCGFALFLGAGENA